MRAVKTLRLLVRSLLASSSVEAELDEELRYHVDRQIDVFRGQAAQAEFSILRERMLANLAAAFGALATALAAVGVYALIAFNVTRKMREIGVRVALGADTYSVVWLIMREVLWLVAIAVAVAVPLAWALGRLVESQFYGVSASDPSTTIAAVALLAAIALLAGYLPARRATRIDPIQVLRAE
jgi:putative ABC transport system permease protein